jgi:Lrp/AsnC family leucine-responsive transcriptional regulator
VNRDRRALDRVDREILNLLQQDGRMTITTLAKRVHLTPTPCYERLRRLESREYIRGYSAILSPEQIGLPFLAFVEVRMVETTEKNNALFVDAVRRLPQVYECYRMVGEFDFLIKLRLKDLISYEKLLSAELVRLPGVATIKTSIVLHEIKSTHQLSLDSVDDIESSARPSK